MKRTDWLKGMVLAIASLLLVACGAGGGSDSQRSPTPVVNDPPASTEPLPTYAASGVGLVDPPSHLYTLSPLSGALATEIGEIVEEGTGFAPAITDIAMTPGGLLFGCSYETLYLIDQATGMAKPLGPLGVRNVNALAFNKTEGFLYGATRDGKVLNINPNRPQDTVILFQLPRGYVSSGDMVFAPDGTLYASLRVDGQENDIIAIIDLEDGSIQPLNTAGSGAQNIFGLSYIDGVLYGLTAAQAPANGALWRIDPTTGVATFLDELPFSAFGSN